MAEELQQNEYDILERRAFIRIPYKYILRCSVFTVNDFMELSPKDVVQGVMKNISSGGALFESQTRFELGTLLKIELALPGWERFKTEFIKGDSKTASNPLTVLGSVVRLEMIEEGRFDIGVCFSAIDEGDRWALIKYIEKKIKS